MKRSQSTSFATSADGDLTWRAEGERIGFECNGHFEGKHGKGWSSDAEKMNEAQMCGWRVLVFTNKQVLRGEAKKFIESWVSKP